MAYAQAGTKKEPRRPRRGALEPISSLSIGPCRPCPTWGGHPCSSASFLRARLLALLQAPPSQPRSRRFKRADPRNACDPGEGGPPAHSGWPRSPTLYDLPFDGRAHGLGRGGCGRGLTVKLQLCAVEVATVATRVATAPRSPPARRRPPLRHPLGGPAASSRWPRRAQSVMPLSHCSRRVARVIRALQAYHKHHSTEPGTRLCLCQVRCESR